MLTHYPLVEAALIRFSSPYPEVRAVVPCTDDYNLPASTFRVWVMGTFCSFPSFAGVLIGSS
jgi:hypothetical protein